MSWTKIIGLCFASKGLNVKYQQRTEMFTYRSLSLVTCARNIKIVVSVKTTDQILNQETFFHFTGMPLTVVIIQSFYH